MDEVFVFASTFVCIYININKGGERGDERMRAGRINIYIYIYI